MDVTNNRGLVSPVHFMRLSRLLQKCVQKQLFSLALLYANSALVTYHRVIQNNTRRLCRYLVVCKQGCQFSLYMVSRQQQLVVISKCICCLLSPWQFTCCGSKGSKSFTSTLILHKKESCLGFPYAESLLCSDVLVWSS